MKLSQQKILKILRGELVPTPDQIEEINRKIKLYYREFYWAARISNLSLELPYEYIPKVQDDGFVDFHAPPHVATHTFLKVCLPRKYSGHPLYLMQQPFIPQLEKDLWLLYLNAGWCDAIALNAEPLPLPWDAVLGGERSPRPDDAVLGGSSKVN